MSPLEEADMAAESQMEDFDITVFHPMSSSLAELNRLSLGRGK